MGGISPPPDPKKWGEIAPPQITNFGGKESLDLPHPPSSRSRQTLEIWPKMTPCVTHLRHADEFPEKVAANVLYRLMTATSVQSRRVNEPLVA